MRAPASSTEQRREAALRILITRPAEQAQALARMLEARGHAVLIEPLLAIEPLPVTPRLEGVQAIAVTSVNAAPALARLCLGDRLPVFAVGEASAAAAREAGCARVEAAGGDAQSLARLIVASCRPADGAILHLSGAEVRPGLAEGLREAGFDVAREVVYRALPAEALSASTQAALREGIDAVLLFSPRTAATFRDLVMRHGLERFLGVTDACCLSAAVADSCRALAWRAVRIAARPEQRALVDLLDAADRRC